MIEAQGLTKRYGPTTAVDHMSFTVQPGRVAGFLGPNGAGKSTTMRMIVGLDRPTDGSVTINGRHYADHRAPPPRGGCTVGRQGRSHGPKRAQPLACHGSHSRHLHQAGR